MSYNENGKVHLIVCTIEHIAAIIGFSVLTDVTDINIWWCIAPSMQKILATLAQLERELILNRKKEGIEVQRANGTYSGVASCGRR